MTKTMQYVLWGIVAFFAFKVLGGGKILGGKSPGAANTTGTNSKAPDPFWTGWGTATDTTLNNTTNSVRQGLTAVGGIYTGLRGLFGGASTATGAARHPQTNGSGAGVPYGSATSPASSSGITGTDYEQLSADVYNRSLLDTHSSTATTEDPNYAGWSYPNSTEDALIGG